MPPTDEIDDLDAPNGETQQAEGQAATADSPPAPGDNKSVIDIVRDVVQPGTQASPADPGKVAEKAAAGSDATEGAEEDDSEAKEPELPYYKDPRFQKIIRQRASYKDQAARYEQDAGRYRNVQKFLDQNGLSAEEAADSLLLAGMIKRGDAEAAWAKIKPIAESLLRQIGGIMPDDLRQRVEKGELTEAAARELSAARAKAENVERRQQTDNELRTRQAHVEQATAIHGAAIEWAKEREQRDPNFADKVPLLQREVLFLQKTEGFPDTPEGVRQQMSKAYKAVNAKFTSGPSAGNGSRKPAVTPVRSGGVAADGAKPRHGSVLEIVRAGGSA